jgi:glycerol-3-phosphate acyltransferase PlsY
VTAYFSRYSSLSALLASALTPIGLLGLGLPDAAALFFLLGILLWVMHRANIQRLLNGTEGKIGK